LIYRETVFFEIAIFKNLFVLIDVLFQIGPEILANIAKNIASVLSPIILSELHARSNRSFQSVRPTVSTKDDYLDSPSAVDNIIDKTTNTASYYQPRSHSYNEFYEEDSARLENSQPNGRLQQSLRDESHRRQERPSFFEPYHFTTNDENFKATQKSIANAGSLIPNTDKSSSNRYSSYHGIGFHKAALAPEPYAGFGGFGSYEHFPGYPHHGHHHHHHPYGSNGDNEPLQSDNGDAPEQNARLENNGSNYGGYGYGAPYFGNHGYHHSYPSFSYGGYGSNHGPFYGPYNENNSSANGRNGYGYRPYHTGGFDFYGSPGYGYGYGYDNNGHSNGNGNNGNSRQTEELAENDDQSNSTKNGYPRPYGPPFVKPLLGAFHLQGFPAPFSLLPYEHFHGVFKGGPVVGVGHVGFPIYAEPYPIGFPFHYPYGPTFHGKKYLPPKGKPADSGESGDISEMARAELTGNENPERISTLSDKVVAPAPSSKQKRLKMSG